MNLLFDENKLQFDEIGYPGIRENNISLTIARLDKIHPVVSGNKLFKLYYFLKEAADTKKNILTFGGAYSNHLVATAYAAMRLGIKSTGIIRGERPALESHTIILCRQYNMNLRFISRNDYNNINDPVFLKQLEEEYPDCVIIPEGGFHPLGAKGASLIMDLFTNNDPTHVILPVGTATTLAGILLKAKDHQQIIAIPVLKNMRDIPARIATLTGISLLQNLHISGDYHFGGYARYTNELISFMNEFYSHYHVPLDFVYTAKMMFGVMNKINSGYFPGGSRILCLHTGGLQGNLSLLKDTLIY